MKKKKTAKQIFAIIAIVLLLSMYVMSLIFAIIGKGFAFTMLKISFVCTFFIPIMAYFIMMFYKLSHPKEHDED